MIRGGIPYLRFTFHFLSRAAALRLAPLAQLAEAENLKFSQYRFKSDMGYMENNTVSTGGFSLSGILTIVFVVLKLTHTINWSWVWVLSPLWISFILWIVMIVGFIVFVALFKNR